MVPVPQRVTNLEQVSNLAIQGEFIQDDDKFRVDVMITATGKKLCTLQVSDGTTLIDLKRALIKKYLHTFTTKLFISERRCVPDVVEFTLNGCHLASSDYRPLNELGFKLGETNKVDTVINRSRAYLTSK